MLPELLSFSDLPTSLSPMPLTAGTHLKGLIVFSPGLVELAGTEPTDTKEQVSHKL